VADRERVAAEIADLVDRDDNVIGRAPRGRIRAEKLLHRGVAVLCRNPAGEIYVHRRTDDKDVFPGMYDMFLGGMVLTGETYEDAARREAAEEIGAVDPDPRLLFKHLYLGEDNPAWCGVFELTVEGQVSPQVEEIAWGAFMNERVLDDALARWPFVPDGVEVYERLRRG
jgi:8-oxo-dGTP pyrophosphatase MutT (NUDIX family)